jgi:hypothetical protein
MTRPFTTVTDIFTAATGVATATTSIATSGERVFDGMGVVYNALVNIFFVRLGIFCMIVEGKDTQTFGFCANTMKSEIKCEYWKDSC